MLSVPLEIPGVDVDVVPVGATLILPILSHQNDRPMNRMEIPLKNPAQFGAIPSFPTENEQARTVLRICQKGKGGGLAKWFPSGFPSMDPGTIFHLSKLSLLQDAEEGEVDHPTGGFSL